LYVTTKSVFLDLRPLETNCLLLALMLAASIWLQSILNIDDVYTES
jgi:hypothetical protein